MYSLIYLTEDIKYINNKNIKSAHVILGGNKWKVLEDKNNCFSIGNEIIYNYKKTGIYRLLFKFNTYSDGFSYTPLTLKIKGIDEQTIYYVGNSYRSNFYKSLLCIVKAKEGMQTNFELNITYDGDWTPKPIDIKGDDKNYNLTFLEVQYIDEGIIEDPIIITDDAKLTLNRRHIVKAPLLKTINLILEDNASINDWVEVKNMDLGNFQINPSSNTQIMLNSYMTKEKTGYIRSKKRGDFVRLECMDNSSKTIFSNTNTVGTFGILQ